MHNEHNEYDEDDEDDDTRFAELTKLIDPNRCEATWGFLRCTHLKGHEEDSDTVRHYCDNGFVEATW